MLHSFVNKIINKRLKRGNIGLSDYNIPFEMFDNPESTISILMLGPDPNFGGSMYEPVMDKIFKKADQANMSVMRISFFKYQIVNNVYDRYIAQAAIALEELKSEIERVSSDVWVVGYSFGALVALNLFLRRPEIKGFVLLSPPLLNYDFCSWITPCFAQGMIIYGSQDPLLNAKSVNMYTQFLSGKKMTVDAVSIAGTSHGFEKKENDVADRVIKFIQNAKTTYR